MAKRDLVSDDDFQVLSPYAQFYVNFLGYNFIDIKHSKTITKGEFWDRFRNLAIKSSVDEPSNFIHKDFTLCNYTERV
jgi:hypothetical protein